MSESACLEFLRWALPRLDLDVKGFRRVRRQVCRRIVRRCEALGVDGFAGYRRHVEAHAEEWPVLFDLCLVHVSRFFRDRRLFETLADHTLPLIAQQAGQAGRSVRIWSAGCAAGEEPYSLALIWNMTVRGRHPALALELIASEMDPAALARAQRGCYARSSLKELPVAWQQTAFDAEADGLCLREEHRRLVQFRRDDLRFEMPDGPFDLILCRNLVFTYFAAGLRQSVADRLIQRLRSGGLLAIGAHERLDPHELGLVPSPDAAGMFRRPGS